MGTDYGNINFAELLELLLAKRQIHKTDFADMVGLSRGEVTNIAAGRRPCPQDKIEKMIEVLKLKGRGADHFKKLAWTTKAPNEEAKKYWTRKITPPPGDPLKG